MRPVIEHIPAMDYVMDLTPRNAIPYSLCGFQRVDAVSEKLPQMFDEAILRKTFPASWEQKQRVEC